MIKSIKERDKIGDSDHLISDDFNVVSESKNENKASLRKDIFNIIFLMFLYLLQSIPLGLSGSLPYILTTRKVSYADQGTFSLAFWPFSLKLLWAPLVDSLYIKAFGRRKSWLVPVQYLIGFYMIFFADFVKETLDNDKLESESKKR